MDTWGAARYGDPCRECGFDWSLTPQEAVAVVADLPARLDAVVAGGDGSPRRAAGGWSVVEYVGHVGDNLRQWAERVQAARLAGRSRVGGYDPDALALARRHADLPLAAAAWSAARAAELWVGVLHAALAEGVELDHATRGLQRAADVARNNAHDAVHHLWDVERIRGEARSTTRRTSSTPPAGNPEAAPRNKQA